MQRVHAKRSVQKKKNRNYNQKHDKEKKTKTICTMRMANRSRLRNMSSMNKKKRFQRKVAQQPCLIDSGKTNQERPGSTYKQRMKEE